MKNCSLFFKFFGIFYFLRTIYLSLGLCKGRQKLQEKPSALKRELATIQNMKFPNFSSFWGHVCRSGSGSGSIDPTESLFRSEHWFLDGQIQLILGPMFSGKSTELIRRLKRYEVAQYKVLIVKYAKVSKI
jgi:hypothetical protein